MVGRRWTAWRGLDVAFSEEAVKGRLRMIRDEAMDCLEDLVRQLTDVCQERYGLEVIPASTAESAAQRIADIARPEDRVLVSRSATVNEIREALLACGLTVVDSYDDEFEHPEAGAKYYWELDIPEPEAAWEGFGHQKPMPQPRPVKDTVALIGINSISAADGTVYLVEHLNNISRLLQQASKVVLLIGLDKIAPTTEDARFVAQAMALFGAPSVALTTSQRGRRSDMAKTAERPPGEEGADQEWHVILLDNQRRWLLTSPYRDLFSCIGCRVCMRECPTFPYFGANSGLTPRDHLWMALRGDGNFLADCVSCGRCGTLCPMGIDLPLLISRVKGWHQPLRDQLFKRINVLFKLSSVTAPLANPAFSTPLVRYPAEWVSGLDHRRVLPRFYHYSFERWAAARRARPAGKEKVVYYYGCYVNYTSPSLGRVVVNLLERNGCEVAIPRQACCGVAAFWDGDRDLARHYARATIRTLLPWVDKGYRVVVTCPSCGLALTHDFLHLLPHDAGAHRLAESTFDVATFVLDLQAGGEWKAPELPVSLRVGYHTPCHLRIRDKGEDSVALLSSVPGLEVVPVDRGCCGLAGSYGMKAKNYAKSMAIGKRIAEFFGDDQFDAVSTDCAGCEMQIHEITGLPVYHPLELLWQGYNSAPEERTSF